MKQPPAPAKEILEQIEDINSLGHLYDIVNAATARIYYIGHMDGQRYPSSLKSQGADSPHGGNAEVLREDPTAYSEPYRTSARPRR
jgi:hypothetical protein